MPRSTWLRRSLTRGGPLALVGVFVLTGLALPVAAPKKPVVEAKVHALPDEALKAGRAQDVDTGIPTEAVGVDWDGRQEGALEVRAREGAAWGPWLRLEGNPSEGPDEGSREHRPRTSAGPLWMGHGIEKVEARVVEGDLHGVRLHAIRSEEPPRGAGVKPAGAAVAQPGIMSRAGWGANEADRSYAPGCGQPEYAASVRNAIVHHTASATNYAPGDGPALVRAIYYFHTHTNMWCDIGYNFLVDRYGQIYEGRYGGITRAVIGAHALNFNTGSTGVGLIGTFQTDAVPAAMYSSLRSLLAWKLAFHGVNPVGTVSANGKVIPTVAAHRDVNATDCPGDLAYGLLPQLRSQLAADVKGSGDKPALVRSSTTFLLKNSQTTGPADGGFAFGDAGDVAVMGDWDGNGTKTPGLFRNGAWYLRNSNTTGVHDVFLGFGDRGDVPVVGDWNGDGIDTPGLFRGGRWYLRNSNTTGVHDVFLGFGDRGDVPVVGDWNGDNVDTPGLHRSGAWYLRNSNTTGVHEIFFGFGDPGDLPVVGDWNGDGVDTPAIFRRGVWYVRNSNSTGRGDVTFGFGDAGDRPLSWS